MTFVDCLTVTLREEGGFVDDPQDSGGITNLGVTLATWERWTKGSVTRAQMRALTPVDVAPMYRAYFWDACDCDNLPQGVDLCVFDFAVNAGVARAARYLQHIVGAGQDGKIGAATVASVHAFIVASSATVLRPKETSDAAV